MAAARCLKRYDGLSIFCQKCDTVLRTDCCKVAEEAKRISGMSTFPLNWNDEETVACIHKGCLCPDNSIGAEFIHDVHHHCDQGSIDQAYRLGVDFHLWKGFCQKQFDSLMSDENQLILHKLNKMMKVSNRSICEDELKPHPQRFTNQINSHEIKEAYDGGLLVEQSQVKPMGS